MPLGVCIASIAAAPEPFLELIAPYRGDLAVAAECMFTWYWLADLCEREGIVFVLGHALYMRPIHGGKAKNDRIDAHKIAALLRGGMLPQAYVYPPEMRATRDLMRRRNYLMRKRAELLVHIQNTNSQYNLPAFGARLAKPHLRREAADHFPEPAVRESVAAVLAQPASNGAMIAATRGNHERFLAIMPSLRRAHAL